MRHVLLAASLCATLLAPRALADVKEVTVQSEACIGSTTLLTKKSVCYEKDIRKAEGVWVIKICAGLVVSGGVSVVLGGEASHVLCAVINVSAETEDDARKQAERALKTELTSGKAAKQLRSRYKVKRIDAGDVTLLRPIKKDDKAALSAVWDQIDKLRLDPSPDAP